MGIPTNSMSRFLATAVGVTWGALSAFLFFVVTTIIGMLLYFSDTPGTKHIAGGKIFESIAIIGAISLFVWSIRRAVNKYEASIASGTSQTDIQRQSLKKLIPALLIIILLICIPLFGWEL